MTNYEENRIEKGRFKIGSDVKRPVMDVPSDPHSSGKHLDKFANSLNLKDDNENIASQIIGDLMNVEEKEAGSGETEKKADKEKTEEKKTLSDEDKESFRKAGQLLALDSVSKAVTGEGLSLEKKAVKKPKKPKASYLSKRLTGAKKGLKEYKLLGRIGLGGARVPLWVATLPVRRPASVLGALAAAGTGLYGYGRYRKKKR